MGTPKIVVPLDGSSFAEQAIPFATEMADKLTCTIELVCVAPHRGRGAHRRVERVAMDERYGFAARPADYLKTTADRIEAVSSAQVLRTVLVGAAAKKLVEHSKGDDTKLFVMSTHGRGPLGRARLGSVADWVACHVSVPVLLIRPEEGVDRDLTDRCGFANILVALDGSRQAEDGLRWARKVGGPETSLLLLRVARNSVPIWAADTTSTPFHVDVRDYRRIGYLESLEYLCGVERLVENEIPHIRSVVLEGVPADVGILRTAERQAADLIVVTTHERVGLPRLILGSVAERVVRASRVPVLVVHRDDTDAGLLAELRNWDSADAHIVNAGQLGGDGN